MTGAWDAPTLLAALAALLAFGALVAAIMTWRATARRAASDAATESRLRALADRIERAALRDTAAPPGFEALRGDIAILFEHVSSLTNGQLDVRNVVGAAVSRPVGALVDRLDEADTRADERAAALRNRVEIVREHLLDLTDAVEALRGARDFAGGHARGTAPAERDALLSSERWTPRSAETA
jgi:hypothetical protein